MNRLTFLLLALLSLFPARAAESVWVSTDRSLYAAGETVWLRGWVSDASGELAASRFLYVELLRDGMASVERRVKIKERSGLFFGHLDLPDNLDSGWYTLRAYTRAQKDWPAEALFHSRVLIRGAGPLPGIPAAASLPETADPETGIKVSLHPAPGGALSISLTDPAGNPVAGNFSLSVVRGTLSDFDYQSAPGPGPVAAPAPEGAREYAQDFEFRVKSVRPRMPDQYRVTVLSRDIGYYDSSDVTGDGRVKGETGQSFRIPDLDYPEETLFTVNVTGSKFLFPAAEEEGFAAPFDYGPTYAAVAEIRDTAVIRERIAGAVPALPADDTLSASLVTAARKSAFYRPDRAVAPFSQVFEWRQVKLREELQKYDDMDLMAYIAAHFPGLVATYTDTGLRVGRTMYCTRSGSFTQRVTVTHGQATINNAAGYHPVELYIDGIRQPDWDEASSLCVGDVKNLYVLRGTEAALYKAAAVVILEMPRYDEKMLKERAEERKTTIGLMPLGWQLPKAFPTAPDQHADRPGTYYWHPCIRTDRQGRAEVALPELPAGCYLRLVGQTLDGRWCYLCIKMRGAGGV